MNITKKQELLNFLSDRLVVIEMIPEVDGHCDPQYLGIRQCQHGTIKELTDRGYSLRVDNGMLLVC